MPEWYLLHPAWVHFPIALLIVGLAVAAWHEFRGGPAWLGDAAAWLLYLGAASVWVAIGLGFLAEKTAAHVPAAWRTLGEHEELAYWTGGLFSALALWTAAVRRGALRSTRRWRRAFLAAWLVSTGVLLSTAYHGGKLVFAHGMGVRQPE